MGSIYRNRMAQALRDTYTHTEPVNVKPKETYWFFGAKEETKMSKWEIMQRVADARKEIETFAHDWEELSETMEEM